MTLVLAIDTASPLFAVAAGDGEGEPRVETASAPQDHSRELLAAIGRVLAGERPGLIAVVCGPGSYAGLRVGIATAEGLSLAHGVPVAGIPTLQTVARASGHRDVTALHPAGRGEFALQEFASGESLRPIVIADPAGLEPLAGEGASAFGGIEVDSRERCIAALTLALRSPESAGEVAPIYVREPSITSPRRSLAGAPPA